MSLSVSDFDWASLEPEHRTTLLDIALPIAERGATLGELSLSLGLERKEILRRRDALAVRLRQAMHH